MKRNFFPLLVAALVCPALLWAGTTGKIKGKVTDRDSGEPLPGANVIVVGTTLGAASDFNGEFVILNIPPGVYTVKTTFVGYQEVSIANLRVNADLTTEANFKLPLTSVEVGEVNIIAEKPLVNKNATNAVRITSSEDIQNLPVRGVGAAIALQPGVVVQDGALYIRGGRNDEVGYYLEGASSRDGNTGVNAITVIPEALEEFQVQAGGFNAEFGGANAGIIRQTLKSGNQNYHFTLQGETDNLVDPGNQFLNTYSYGHTDYTATFSGPVPKTNNKLRFFLAGQNVFNRDRLARFWQGFDINHAPTYVDEHNFPLVFTDNSGVPLEAWVQQQGIHMRDGIIPRTANEQWTGNGTLVYDANPFVFRVGGSLSYLRADGIGGLPNFVANYFNRDRTRKDALSTGLYNFKFTHLLSAKSFYEVNLNYFDRRQVLSDPIFKHNIWAYWDSTASAERGINFYNWEDPTLWQGGNSFDIHGFDFFAPGAPSGGQGLPTFPGLAYNKNKRTYVGGSFGFTTQYRSHELKLGASIERWTARNFSTNPRQLLLNARAHPDDYRAALAGDPVELSNFASGAGTAQWLTYGYDPFGNENNVDGPDGPRHPQYFSSYLQDRFEVSDLVINAGLRLDLMDNDDFVFRDPSSPPWDRTNHRLLVDQLVKKKADVEISPRLGLAFPVTERTVFHLQYGKFVQAPSFANLYNGNAWFDAIFVGGTSFQNNLVGVGVEPEKTIQYEIGFNQQFADNAAFDVTLFYKNISGQLQTARILTNAASSPAASYNLLINGDYATTSGLELALNLRRTNRVAGQINYTYSRSLGTGSVPNSAIAGIELGQELPTVISPLNFNRPHVGSLNVDYRFGKGDGGRWLERTGLNLLLTFSSGHPFTLSKGDFGQQDESFGGEITDPRAQIPLESINSSLTPWNMQLNLRLDRTIDLGPVETNFYFYVQNLTNRMNVLNVYNRTGNPFNDGFLDNAALSNSIVQANGGPAFVALHQAINLNGNGTNYSWNTGNQLLGQPRTIRVGARVQF